MSSKKIKNKTNISKSFYDLSKDPEWQIVRKKLLNKWMCKPDWSCLQIRRYIGNMYTCHNNKLKIISGYLSSSGFRPGAIHRPCITKLRNEILDEIKKRKLKGTWE